MPEEHDPVQLIVRLTATAFFSATVALSVGSLGDLAAVHEQRFIAGEQLNLAVRDLARCRIVTSEQYLVDEACRHVLADNRQRFFGLDQRLVSASTANTPAPSQQSSANNRADSNHPSASPAEKE